MLPSPAVLAGRGGTKAIPVPQPHFTWPNISPDLVAALIAQASRSLSEPDGSGVTAMFEQEFAAFYGTRFGVAFASGTSALHAMCNAASLPEGAEILCCTYGFFATVSPFAYEGIRPVFCDSDNFGNPSVASLRQNLTPRTRAVIVVHMWGNPCDMDSIVTFCEEHDLLLLEDCSHAHFATWGDRRVGTFGKMAVFSLNQKAITAGEGGILITNDERCRDYALLSGHYNARCKRQLNPTQPYYAYWRTGMGLKHRPHPLSMAVALHQLRSRTDIETRRRHNLEQLAGAASQAGVLQPLVIDPALGRHGLYVLAFRVNNAVTSLTRDQLHNILHDEGATEFDIPNSTRLMYDEPLFRRTRRNQPWDGMSDLLPTRPEADFPVAARVRDTLVKLPLWGYDGDEEIVNLYCEAITKVSDAVRLSC
jgi:dTDP-4-amino-4,6-dideoxygalactose transaminase